MSDDTDLDDPAGVTTRPLCRAGAGLLTHLSRPDDVEWDDVHGATDVNDVAEAVLWLRCDAPIGCRS